MAYRLNYRDHDFALPSGEFVIGRSSECQLAINDPLMSRRHAVLHVRGDEIMIDDLGSRNGVLVNGTRIAAPFALTDGDVITLGNQEVRVVLGTEDRAALRESAPRRMDTQTMVPINVADARSQLETTMDDSVLASWKKSSKSHASFRLIGGVADKALAMGRVDEAERLLHGLLSDVICAAREGRLPESSVTEEAATYAARLAAATGRASWADYIFELYKLARKPLPSGIVDELYGLVRKLKTLEPFGLRAYLQELHVAASSFGPADRFLVQRIEGLERLVSVK